MPNKKPFKERRGAIIGVMVTSMLIMVGMIICLLAYVFTENPKIVITFMGLCIPFLVILILLVTHQLLTPWDNDDDRLGQ